MPKLTIKPLSSQVLGHQLKNPHYDQSSCQMLFCNHNSKRVIKNSNTWLPLRQDKPPFPEKNRKWTRSAPTTQAHIICTPGLLETPTNTKMQPGKTKPNN